MLGSGGSGCLTCPGSLRGPWPLALRLHSGMKALCRDLRIVSLFWGLFSGPRGHVHVPGDWAHGGGGGGGPWGHSPGTGPWGGRGGWPTLLSLGRASCKGEGTPEAQPLWPQAIPDLPTFAYLPASSQTSSRLAPGWQAVRVPSEALTTANQEVGRLEHELPPLPASSLQLVPQGRARGRGVTI